MHVCGKPASQRLKMYGERLCRQTKLVHLQLGFEMVLRMSLNPGVNRPLEQAPALPIGMRMEAQRKRESYACFLEAARQ